MDFFSIIIDRVASTNVFNIIQGRLPTRDTHLQTRVDDDLILEFLEEVERLAHISASMGDASGAGARRPGIDVSKELRRVGETFFLQFFPEQIQERLRHSGSSYLFLHVDHRLRNIPWELLHDGRCFLADKLYMGKNVSGYWRDAPRSERDRLRMLIIADPTEDLEWARNEGEGLFEALNAEVSPDRLDVQFMSGRRITKLALLNAIKDRDIIHYAGHMYYSRDQQESGWLLADGKVLRAREIEKAGVVPGMVFSNSCLSSAAEPDAPGDDEARASTLQSVDCSASAGASSGDGAGIGEAPRGRFNDLAGAFLRTGIGAYVGTNWEISDNQSTYDFALHFYRALFEERSVGEALFEARRHARHAYPSHDLTWANYVLHGNPIVRIFRSPNRRTFDASRSVLFVRRVLDSYPLPIAREYLAFQEASEEGEGAASFEALWALFENTLLTVGAIVFGNCRFLNLKQRFPEVLEFDTLRDFVEGFYECMASVRALQLELAAGRILESLYLHRDTIDRMLGAREKWLCGELDPADVESYAVTYQYFLDNLLSDLGSLGRHKLLYLEGEGEEALVLNGLTPHRIRLLPAEFEEPQLRETARENRGQVCFYNSSRRALFSLAALLELDEASGLLRFPALIGEPAGHLRGALRLGDLQAVVRGEE